jgi:hypothetical protein
VILLAALVSFLPIAILNTHYAGDWMASKLEPPCCIMKNPAVGLYGNTLQLLFNNFVPPVFPLAGWWNEHIESFLPASMVAAARKNFDCSVGGGPFSVPELQTDDYAGIGFGVCVLLVVSVLAPLWVRRSKPGAPAAGPIPPELCLWVRIAPWISLAAYCMGTGMVTSARLIAPYYPFLLPLLLVGPAQSEIIRRRWWHAMTGGVLILAFVVLVLSPDRPLWPAQTVLTKLAAKHPDQRLLTRALRVYAVYAGRSDSLAGGRDQLPPGIKAVGFIGTGDDVAISLWRPYGQRHVEIFLLTDPPEQIRQRVQYVVIGEAILKLSGTTIDDWLQKSGAELVATTNATQRVAEGPQPWYVVRFKP